MTTTPSDNRQNSSADQEMTDFKDGLGNPIPAAAFENDPGPPRTPVMTEEARARFDAKTAELKATLKKKEPKAD